MQKDQSYHEAAIAYNEGLAEFAENLAPTLGHEEVRKWCTAVGKQHRFHAKRHQSALNKILLRQPAEEVEHVADGLDVPEPAVEEEVVVERKVTPSPVLSDGCDPFHDPTNPNCDFRPKENANA